MVILVCATAANGGAAEMLRFSFFGRNCHGRW